MTTQVQRSEWWLLAATILASGLAFLSSTAVNVALPAMQRDLGATLADIQWIVNSFSIALAAFMLTGGSLGDIYGWRRMFTAGIGLFTVGSLMAGLTHSIPILILARCIQGFGSALQASGSLAVINTSIPAERRGRAIGLWAGLSGAVAALGPFLAGWLVERSGWPAVFLINVPLGLFVGAVVWFVVPSRPHREDRRIDWWGTVWASIALIGSSYALIQGPIEGWRTLFVWLTGLVSLLAFGAFGWTEVHIDQPMVPFKLFRRPVVLGANLATLFLYGALSGCLFFLTLALQQAFGYSPAQAGLALLPLTALIGLLSGFGGAIADRIGPRFPMILGSLLVAAGMTSFAFAPAGARYLVHFLPGLVVFGIGMALVIAPLTKSALEVETSFSGVAAGVNNLASRASGLIVVAVLGGVMLSLFQPLLAKSLTATNLPATERQLVLTQAPKLGAIDSSVVPASHQPLVTISVRTAFLGSFRWMMLINAGLAALGALMALIFIIRPRTSHVD